MCGDSFYEACLMSIIHIVYFDDLVFKLSWKDIDGGGKTCYINSFNFYYKEQMLFTLFIDNISYTE